MIDRGSKAPTLHSVRVTRLPQIAPNTACLIGQTFAEFLPLFQHQTLENLDSRSNSDQFCVCFRFVVGFETNAQPMVAALRPRIPRFEAIRRKIKRTAQAVDGPLNLHGATRPETGCDQPSYNPRRRRVLFTSSWNRYPGFKPDVLGKIRHHWSPSQLRQSPPNGPVTCKMQLVPPGLDPARPLALGQYQSRSVHRLPSLLMVQSPDPKLSEFSSHQAVAVPLGEK